jgi:hypothetical protein
MPGYRTQVGIADVWTVDDPVEIPDDLPSWVTREDYIAHVRNKRKSEYLCGLFKRIMVESLGLYQLCGNDACRRAGGCCSRRVACWKPHSDLLHAAVVPGFKQALRASRERAALEGRVAHGGPDPDWDPRIHAERFRAMMARRRAGTRSRPPGQSVP